VLKSRTQTVNPINRTNKKERAIEKLDSIGTVLPTTKTDSKGKSIGTKEQALFSHISKRIKKKLDTK